MWHILLRHTPYKKTLIFELAVLTRPWKLKIFYRCEIRPLYFINYVFCVLFNVGLNFCMKCVSLSSLAWVSSFWKIEILLIGEWSLAHVWICLLTGSFRNPMSLICFYASTFRWMEALLFLQCQCGGVCVFLCSEGGAVLVGVHV